jgi:CBS domain-containing protein
MTIQAILQRRSGDIHTLSGDTRVVDAVRALSEKRIGAMPVLDDGAVVGIFSERDVVYGLAQDGDAFLRKAVVDVMIKPVVTVTADTGVLTALSLMTRRRIRHLPVVDDGVLSGFVSIGDLVKHRIDGIEAEAAAMRDYIAS